MRRTREIASSQTDAERESQHDLAVDAPRHDLGARERELGGAYARERLALRASAGGAEERDPLRRARGGAPDAGGDGGPGECEIAACALRGCPLRESALRCDRDRAER